MVLKDGPKPIAAVVGAGRTKFGELWYDNPEKLLVEAGVECIESVDNGMGRRDIQACFFGSFLYQHTNKRSLIPGYMAQELGLNIPMNLTEAACASGGAAVYNAVLAVNTGEFDIVLAGGFEKMSDRMDKITDDLMFAADPHEFDAGFTFPGLYAVMMVRYLYDYGKGDERCLDAMAIVSCKNHHHAMGNPYAHFQREFTVEAVKSSRLVSDPVRLLHCSPISDGAASVIITSPEKAKEMTDSPIYIYASQMATDNVSLSTRVNLTGIKSTRLAMGAALEQAGMEISEIPIAEVHDCFTVEEVMYLEDSGFYKTGEAWKGVYDSYRDYEGLRHIPYARDNAEVIINPGGGLKADGHPVGATGVRQVFEVYRQLRGEAGDCQVESDGDLDVALCHNIGGTGGICTVHILGR